MVWHSACAASHHERSLTGLLKYRGSTIDWILSVHRFGNTRCVMPIDRWWTQRFFVFANEKPLGRGRKIYLLRKLDQKSEYKSQKMENCLMNLLYMSLKSNFLFLYLWFSRTILLTHPQQGRTQHCQIFWDSYPSSFYTYFCEWQVREALEEGSCRFCSWAPPVQLHTTLEPAEPSDHITEPGKRVAPRH